jgi:hypothetical protein
MISVAVCPCARRAQAPAAGGACGRPAPFRGDRTRRPLPIPPVAPGALIRSLRSIGGPAATGPVALGEGRPPAPIASATPPGASPSGPSVLSASPPARSPARHRARRPSGGSAAAVVAAVPSAARRRRGGPQYPPRSNRSARQGPASPPSLARDPARRGPHAEGGMR